MRAEPDPGRQRIDVNTQHDAAVALVTHRDIEVAQPIGLDGDIGRRLLLQREGAARGMHDRHQRPGLRIIHLQRRDARHVVRPRLVA